MVGDAVGGWEARERATWRTTIVPRRGRWRSSESRGLERNICSMEEIADGGSNRTVNVDSAATASAVGEGGGGG